MDTDFLHRKYSAFEIMAVLFVKLKEIQACVVYPEPSLTPHYAWAQQSRRGWFGTSANSHFYFYTWCYIGTVYIWLKVACSWAPLWLTGNRADPKMEAWAQ